MQFFNGRFYLYGNRLGTNRVDSILNCPFAVYSSPNLRDWTNEGDLLNNAPKGFYYRPYVVFNPRTEKYILWYNWYQKLWNGQEGVAVSDTPTGPFKIVNQKVHSIGSSPGDGSLFVDQDGTGYYIYTDIANDYSVRVERLTPDYFDSCGQASPVLARGGEAPLLFRRQNCYYALCGPLCADAAQGSEVQVFTSGSPLGPFSPSNDINRRSVANSTNYASDGILIKSKQGIWIKYRSQSAIPNIPAQETWVAQIPSGDQAAFIWMGDLWQSSPDGTRGHDCQYWSPPLQFTPGGQILPIHVAGKWYIAWGAGNP